MIFRKQGRAPQEEGEWREWFAWHPVYLMDTEGYHTIFWFTRIERRFHWSHSGASDGMYREWEYRG